MPTTELVHDSGWFDSHCHLDEVNLLSLRLAQAAQHSIHSFLIPGTQVSQWPNLIALKSNHVGIAFGTHPWFVSEPDKEAEVLRGWLSSHEANAIGEIGLDFHQGKQVRPDIARQLDAFEQQLTIAREFNLPVIIHSVKAHNDVIRLLKQYDIQKGVVHAFTGSRELAKSYVEQGFHLGVGPIILKSAKTLNALNSIPLDCLMLETDAPFMAITSDSSANPLLDLISVAKKLAELKSVELDCIREQTRLNAMALFFPDR
jgi:TatD DNase family protein